VLHRREVLRRVHAHGENEAHAAPASSSREE
jgi:hypothetical protein